MFSLQLRSSNVSNNFILLILWFRPNLCFGFQTAVWLNTGRITRNNYRLSCRAFKLNDCTKLMKKWVICDLRKIIGHQNQELGTVLIIFENWLISCTHCNQQFSSMAWDGLFSLDTIKVRPWQAKITMMLTEH